MFDEPYTPWPDELLDDPAFQAYCDALDLARVKRSLPVASRKNKIAKSRIVKLRMKAGNAKRRGDVVARIVADHRLAVAEHRLARALAS